MDEFDPFNYNSFATNASDVVHRVTRSVAAEVAALESAGRAGELPPILVFKSTVDATVTNEAVVSRLLGRLPEGRNELVLFDVNRAADAAPLLVPDPGEWTRRLAEDGALPFTLRVVTNEHIETDAVVLRSKPPRSDRFGEEVALGLAWPDDVLSLSHVALPFPPNDPLYGAGPAPSPDRVFLGDLSLRSERGLIDLPPEFQLRMRYNPFYEVLERRSLEWIEQAPVR